MTTREIFKLMGNSGLQGKYLTTRVIVDYKGNPAGPSGAVFSEARDAARQCAGHCNGPNGPRACAVRRTLRAAAALLSSQTG